VRTLCAHCAGGYGAWKTKGVSMSIGHGQAAKQGRRRSNSIEGWPVLHA
jgi:hypothetical protein